MGVAGGWQMGVVRGRGEIDPACYLLDCCFFLLPVGLQCSKTDPVLMPKFQDVMAKIFLESLYDTFSFLRIQGRHLEILKPVSGF